jgi:LuxR family transcriptional regulator, quorum-sensing system regulator BjaR1
MIRGKDAYWKRALYFVEQLQRLRSYESICAHILKEMQWFGFNCVSSFSVPGPGEALQDCLWMNTRPKDYIERYAEKNYILADPVITEFRRNIYPFSWSDVRRNRNLTKTEKTIIDEAREWDARDGLMVPIVTRSGSISGFTPCGLKPDLSPRARAALEVIAFYSHHALIRAKLQKAREEVKHVPLSPREREVMQWVLAGKTDDEIGEILTLATSTVTSHVENAKRKFDTFRRTYAAIQAVRAGEISLW